uniref:NADH dehydrogenase subunit 4L n=1 Tax=Didymobothrium rudolphii TaxID=423277 RepID=A0A8F7CBK9_9CEST|nr:NADH dehydrogenase subunit 4L [Didymobothrium rudolphii]
MLFIFILLWLIVCLGFILSLGRFLGSLIILENFNILVLLFSLLSSYADCHILFILIMVISTIEVIVGLVVLTRVWECTGSMDLASF